MAQGLVDATAILFFSVHEQENFSV